jgi:hypothetical protein
MHDDRRRLRVRGVQAPASQVTAQLRAGRLLPGQPDERLPRGAPGVRSGQPHQAPHQGQRRRGRRDAHLGGATPPRDATSRSPDSDARERRAAEAVLRRRVLGLRRLLQRQRGDAADHGGGLHAGRQEQEHHAWA